LGIHSRLVLGIVALALANAPATPSASLLAELMPGTLAAGLPTLVPAGPALAAGRPVARPDELARAGEGPAPERAEVLRPRLPRKTGDLDCLAEAVYSEARGPGAAGERAVAHVVVNRAKARSFPDTVCGVVHDGCQFSYRCDGRSDALAEPASRARAYQVAETVLAGAKDITSGALFFHSAKAGAGFKGHRKVGVIGGNVFYR
jgi:spore germination cell wall hydrolase CwlJ-like protein